MKTESNFFKGNIIIYFHAIGVQTITFNLETPAKYLIVSFEIAKNLLKNKKKVINEVENKF